MSSFIESYTEPNTWKRSNIALIKAIIDEKKSLSSRLVTLKTVTDSLNEPVRKNNRIIFQSLCRSERNDRWTVSTLRFMEFFTVYK